MEKKNNVIDGCIIVELLDFDSFKVPNKLTLIGKDNKEPNIPVAEMNKYFIDHPRQGIVLKSASPFVKDGDRIAITLRGVENGISDPFLMDTKIYIRIYTNDVLWVYED